MNLRSSHLLIVIILAVAGCASDEKLTLDARTMTARLDGKEISLDAFQEYLEDETHRERTITVVGWNEVETEMKPVEVISAFNQMAEELNEYYSPEEGDQASHDDAINTDSLFE